MKFNKKKELLDGLLDYLVKLAGEETVDEKEAEVTIEEVKEDDKYEMVEGGFVFVKEDGTVYFEDENKTVEPNTEIELVGNKILVIGDDGKFVEIKDKEVVEEELPVEAPVELEDVVEVETVEVVIDGNTYTVTKEVGEAIKSMVEVKEEEKKDLENKIEELSSKVQKLESMIPSISPVGIEISKEELGCEKPKKKVYTLKDFVND